MQESRYPLLLLVAPAVLLLLALFVYTLVIVGVSTALVAVLAAVIGGYLVLGEHPAAVAALKFLYRWPLFVPFIVAAQCMRTFLAKNGMLNNTLDTLGLIEAGQLSGVLF